jgi:hypothetical protein
MDLIRQLLLVVEQETGDNSLQASSVTVQGRTPNDILGHFALMDEAGLLEVQDVFGDLSSTGPDDRFIAGLTWAGHDFLEAARNDGLWLKAKGLVQKAGGPATLEVFKQALDIATKQALKSITGE